MDIDTPRAHRIGSLLFCPTCGTLLDLPGEDDLNVKCEQCGHLEPASSYENHEVVTRSRPDAFPSILQLKRTTQTKEHLDANVKTKTAETCPKCGHKEALSQERQVFSFEILGVASTNDRLLYSCGAPTKEALYFWSASTQSADMDGALTIELLHYSSNGQ
ncbi:DNA-directed RNA polymerase I subunit A12 [Ceratobasidium theobromae]|uniref:DNA-directed RNA polymerase I subunit A12 n=1 Tax=Ceratobasidium theobromae TaxID=1582974 RepID=A0A5N5QIY2_9AGAM|nr:DNA-directed RNA polymerase I subunit A12 [Ceratobasidium theobromae]